jgi:MFS transporter, AAHS family, benzoate transport protein
VQSASSRGGWLQPLCWTVVLDGFGLVALGVVFPVLLSEPVWRLRPGTAVAGPSSFTLLSVAAPSALVFRILRFLAGLGLGGCLPAAVTMVAGYKASRGRAGVLPPR